MTKRKTEYETYTAVADATVAKAVAKTASPFAIEVRFLGGLTPRQQTAFKRAADRWSKVIVGDLPSVQVGTDLIDDVLILASGITIDGPGRILGQAGPTRLRPASAGAAAFLPAKGQMQFDTADLADMETNGTLEDVITHEMGHVLGIGTIWTNKGLLTGAGGSNPTFRGAGAMREFGTLMNGAAQPVPVENRGGPGTADSHWRESVFGTELMTGIVAGAGNPMSRLTVASLADLGYQVNLAAAEAYTLPSHLLMAVAGAFASAPSGMVMPIIPTVLPDESLDV
ncbi:MAG TPA: leishmanolysin-related zinc metalloendopeptidase [Thermoanaerobaculia bacterium]|jgi:hypothetical protein|nr:leishmanolysin-related zinc metalloendopeptidase [Thermoanaerobaculia bacterium]